MAPVRSLTKDRMNLFITVHGATMGHCVAAHCPTTEVISAEKIQELFFGIFGVWLAEMRSKDVCDWIYVQGNCYI